METWLARDVVRRLITCVGALHVREFRDRGAADNLGGDTIFEFQNIYGELRRVTQSYKHLQQTLEEPYNI